MGPTSREPSQPGANEMPPPARRDACLVPPRQSRAFELAGLSVRYRNELDGGIALGLPSTYSLFEIDLAGSEKARLDIGVTSAPRLQPCSEPPLKKAVHWTVFGSSRRAIFDFRHVPTSQVYCRAELEPQAGVATVTFAETTWREGGGARLDPTGRTLPFPLEQLLLLPVFALEECIVLHAGGGLVDKEAFVYAGHSGDGKSTLSGLLASEGVALLSDERVVIRKQNGEFVAHGTPWSGLGNVAARLSGRLELLLLLRKSPSHELSPADTSLVPELVSRAVIPYYFHDLAREILRLFDEMSRRVPLHELRFAKAPGVRDVLTHRGVTATMPIA